MGKGPELEMDPRRGSWAGGAAVGRGPAGSHGLGTRRDDGPQDGMPNRWVRGKCQGSGQPEGRILEQGLGIGTKPETHL